MTAEVVRTEGQPGGAGLQSAAYDAFVSYSHAADDRLAPSLQAGLQSLAKPWYRRRALRVFRDRTSLAASPELWSSIERALDESRFLILLASPDAARSQWVNQEIDWWREHRPQGTLLIGLTDGELEWDASSNDFDITSSALPTALRGWFVKEPLWVDLRWARSEKDLSPRNPRFQDSLAELAAPLRGASKDDLIGHDIREHRRAIRLARTVVVLLTVLAAAAGIAAFTAVVQRNQAVEQTQNSLARQISATAQANLTTRLDIAQRLAAEGYHRRQNEQTSAALFQAVAASPHLVRVVENDARITSLHPLDSRHAVTGAADGGVRVWTVTRGTIGAPLIKLGNEITALSASRRGEFITAGDASGALAVLDRSRRRLHTVEVDGSVTGVAVDQSGRWLIAADDGFGVTVFDLAAGVVLAHEQVENPVNAMAIEAGGRRLMLGSNTGPVQRRRLPDLHPVSVWSDHKLPASYATPAYSANRKFFGMYKFGVDVTDTATETRWLNFPISTSSAHAVAIANDASLVAVASADAISVAHPDVPGDAQGFGASPGGLLTDPLSGISGRITAVQFLGDSRRVVAAAGNLLALWDLNQYSRIADPLPATLTDMTNLNQVPGLAVSPHERYVAWTTEGGTLHVWDTTRNEWALNSKAEAASPVAFSSDGESLVAVHQNSIGQEGKLRIWNLDTPDRPSRRISKTHGSDTGVVQLQRLRNADSLLVQWADGHIDRLNLSTGRLTPLVDAPSQSLAWLGDLAIAPRADVAFETTRDGEGMSTLSHIDLTSGRRTRGPELGLNAIATIALSTDGRFLYAADGTETLVVWDTLERRTVRRLAVGRAARIAVSPDGKWLVTVTFEGLMTIWDPISGTRLGDIALREREKGFSPDIGGETEIRFSRDSRSVFTASTTVGLLRWQMDEGAWTAAVCKSTSRSLTTGEWNRYVDSHEEPTFSCR